MLEARSYYGYYGTAGGYTGETPPREVSPEQKVWDAILEYDIATESELQLVTSINGYSVETLNDVIYSRTGYNDLEQYLESEHGIKPDDDDDDDDDDDGYSSNMYCDNSGYCAGTSCPKFYECHK